MTKFNATLYLERGDETNEATFEFEVDDDYSEAGYAIREAMINQMPDWVADDCWDIADSEYTRAIND